MVKDMHCKVQSVKMLGPLLEWRRSQFTPDERTRMLLICVFVTV